MRAPKVALLTRLQRGAGNHAVTAMIQRYDAFEHAKEGDKAAGSRSLNVGGETLTSGEVNALADLYGTPDDLLKADPKEIKVLVGLVRRQVASRDRAVPLDGGQRGQLRLRDARLGLTAELPGEPEHRGAELGGQPGDVDQRGGGGSRHALMIVRVPN